MIVCALAKTVTRLPDSRPLGPALPSCLTYADDILLMATSHADMQLLLKSLVIICHRLQLKIEPLKSQFMLFNSTPEQRASVPPFVIYGYGAPKPLVNEVTYLGLKIDNHCSAHTMMDQCMKNARLGCISPGTCLHLRLQHPPLLPLMHRLHEHHPGRWAVRP